MRQMRGWTLVLSSAIVAIGTLEAQSGPSPLTTGAGAGAVPGARVLVDAHNAYPTEGQWHDRIDRALGTGLPVAIEQDLFWYTDPRTGAARSVVAHTAEEAAGAPAFEQYFFTRLKPVMDKALADNRQEDWPLVVLNLDFKSNEPDHLAAVWALLGKYEAWLTTAVRTAGNEPAPLQVRPMMVLTGSSTAQQVVFYDQVPVGQTLRLFGAIVSDAPVPGADAKERAINYASAAPSVLISGPATNYRRWVNFPWAAVEAGGQTVADAWRPEDTARLRAMVARAHEMTLWIRFYTLNGHSVEANRGWTASYNFGSHEAAAIRWRQAIDAGVDFIASDQYEALAAEKKAVLSARQAR